ncbi:hypothetical protein BGZ76_003241 [Entomortierella beljakovae]|nr:hypothetical protein BGZ76_003241 [Entomortierella beljakovae]
MPRQTQRLVLSQQQVSRFHTSSPNQFPVPLLPAALFTLKTPVTAVVLRMVSRLSLTLLPLSVKRSPKVILALVMTPPICFAIIIFAGLEAAPNTGRWRFLFINEEEELDLLKDEISTLINSIETVSEDDPRTKLVRHILNNLLSTSIEKDGSTLRTGILEKLEKKHEEAQRRLKELQQSGGAATVTDGSETSDATKAIVSKQRPVSTATGSNQGYIVDDEDEEEDPELAAISFNDRPFQIFVAQDDSINAFSLGPPRLIYINSGLMEWLDNDEDLIAAVVAHELAHVIQRHTMETHGRETVMLFLADLLRSALWTVSIPLGPWFNSWVDSTTHELLHFTASGPLHQRIEVEADTVSLTLMALAGYDPMHSVRLWEQWADKDQREMDDDEKESHKWTDWILVSQVDEDGDLKEATVEDVMETMDELLKQQEEEERQKEVTGILGRWISWRPWSNQNMDVGSAEPAKA